jgi:hypothetical protein
MKKAQRRAGRPARVAETGERVSLGLRVTPKLKNLLDAAARDNGRSQSAEGASRLEASFRTEGFLSEALALRYGQPLAGILIYLGEVARQTTRGLQGVDLVESGEWPDLEQPDFWLQDPALFGQVEKAIALALDRIRPAGEPQPLTLDYAADGLRDVLDGKATRGTGVAINEMIKPIIERAKRNGDR